jgi:hypothetical protein
MIASAGNRLGEKTGWFSALRYRYFGPRRPIEDVCFGLGRDDRFFARPWSILDGRQRPIGQRPLHAALNRLMVDPNSLPHRTERRILAIGQQHLRPGYPARGLRSRPRENRQSFNLLVSHRHLFQGIHHRLGLSACLIEGSNSKFAPRERAPFVAVHGQQLTSVIQQDHCQLKRPFRLRLQKCFRRAPSPPPFSSIMDLPNPEIRSHYRNGFIKQYVRDHLILRTEAASNNVNDYGVKKAVENLPCPPKSTIGDRR